MDTTKGRTDGPGQKEDHRVSTLRAHIRDEIERSDVVDPREIAARVARNLELIGGMREALEEALPHLVRDVILATRPRAQVQASEATPTTATSAKSWKRSAIRQAEVKRRTALDAYYAIGDGLSRRLGDFSYEEMVALAEECQKQAEATAYNAARFARVAEMMKDAGAEKVEDIADAVLELWD